MKSTIKLLFVSLLVSLVFTSCLRKADRYDSQRISFHSAEAQFFGDPGRIGIDFYDLYLFDSKLTSNPNGDGVFVYLQLNSDITSVNEILPGTYVDNNSSSARKFTFEPGSWKTDNLGDYVVGSYVGEYRGNQTILNPISRGNLKIERNGQNYLIKGVVKADGRDYDLVFQGGIDMFDMVVPLPETLTHGEIWYYGNIQGNQGAVKLYTIRLGADDVKISNFSGSGDAMQIEIYTPVNISPLTIIPDNVYPIRINDVVANTAGDGYFDEEDQADYGTWYYTADALSVNDGYVKTTYLDGSYYRLEFSFTDDYYGYNFPGIYEGELAFVNKTSSPIAVRQLTPRLDNKPVINGQVIRENRNGRGEFMNERNKLNVRKQLRNTDSLEKVIRQKRD